MIMSTYTPYHEYNFDGLVENLVAMDKLEITAASMLLT